jgi:hypothetical protein
MWSNTEFPELHYKIIWSLSGTLRFGKIDVTEAQITIIFIHLMSAIFGPSVWMTKVSIWKCANCIYLSQNLFLFYGFYHQ